MILWLIYLNQSTNIIKKYEQTKIMLKVSLPTDTRPVVGSNGR